MFSTHVFIGEPEAVSLHLFICTNIFVKKQIAVTNGKQPTPRCKRGVAELKDLLKETSWKLFELNPYSPDRFW